MPPSRPATINALSGARAIPPLILVLFHFCEAHGYRGAKWFDLPVGKGYLWVEFFFALSGFVLTYVYAPRVAEFWRGRAYVPFLKARFARLYPLHLATLLVILLLVIVLRWAAHQGGYVSIYDVPWHPIVSWQTFVANLFLVQAWNLFSHLSWNGAAWFVSVEWLLCLLFPIWAWIGNGRWVVALLLLLAGGVALGFLATTGKGLDITFHNGVYRGAASFGIGVGFAMLYRDTKARADALPDYAFSLAQLGVLAVLGWAIYCTGWSHRPQDIYTVLPEMALVYVLAFDRGFMATFFSSRVPQFFGEISYGVYMGQIAILQLLDQAKEHWYPPANAIVLGRPWIAWEPVWHWLEPALILTLAILWGWALYAWVEQPCATFLRRWFEPPEISGHPAMTLVTLARFDTQAEAYALCGRLWSEEIVAFPTFQYHVGNNWAVSIALGGVRIQVPVGQAVESREILRKSQSGELKNELGEMFGDLGDRKCPHCGSERVRKRRPLGQVTLAALLTFYVTVFPPWDWLYVCARCGKTLRGGYGLIGNAHFDGFAKTFAEATSADFEEMQAAGIIDNMLVTVTMEKVRGWVCRIDGEQRGWCVVDLASRSIATLAVDPDFVREGIGEGLHNRAVAWLFANGAETISASVSPTSRAEKFYRAFGWTLADIKEDGDYQMDLVEPAWRLKMTRRRSGFWARLRLPAEN